MLVRDSSLCKLDILDELHIVYLHALTWYVVLGSEEFNIYRCIKDVIDAKDFSELAISACFIEILLIIAILLLNMRLEAHLKWLHTWCRGFD